jgi:hypothetical protein
MLAAIKLSKSFFMGLIEVKERGCVRSENLLHRQAKAGFAFVFGIGNGGFQ